MKVEIKDRIKQALEIRGMLQSELAEKASIDKGQLSSYISGKYKPRQNNIDALSLALNVSEAWLMGFDVPMKRNSEKENLLQEETYPLHCKEILDVCQQLSVSNRSRVLSYSKKLLDTQQMEQELLAAHARTDIKVTAEDIQHDLDLMDDDGWEE